MVANIGRHTVRARPRPWNRVPELVSGFVTVGAEGVTGGALLEFVEVFKNTGVAIVTFDVASLVDNAGVMAAKNGSCVIWQTANDSRSTRLAKNATPDSMAKSQTNDVLMTDWCPVNQWSPMHRTQPVSSIHKLSSYFPTREGRRIEMIRQRQID